MSATRGEAPDGYEIVGLQTQDGEPFEAILPLVGNTRPPIFVHDEKSYAVRGLMSEEVQNDSALNSRWVAVKSAMEHRGEVHSEAARLRILREATKQVDREERKAMLGLAVDGIAEPESLGALMVADDAVEVPLVKDRDGKTMLRMGNDGSFLAPQKAGKTEGSNELLFSLVTGAPLFDFYSVEALPKDWVVVSLDAENDRVDRKTQWSPMWDLMDSDQQARIVPVPLGDVPCSMFDLWFREWLIDYAKPLIDGRFVGAIMADTLGSLTSMTADDLKDPSNAVKWRREVLPHLREAWGDERTTTMTLMHSARYLQKAAFDLAPLGGPHWDAQLSPHWRMPLDPVLQHSGPRLFGVMPSRGSIRSDPQYLAKTASGRLVVDGARSDEAQAVLLGGTKAAVAKAKTKSKQDVTDDLVLRSLNDSSGAYDGTGSGLVPAVAALAKADGLTKGEYLGRRQDLSESLKRLANKGRAESAKVAGNDKFRRTEAGDLFAIRLESDSPAHVVSTAAAVYGTEE